MRWLLGSMMTALLSSPATAGEIRIAVKGMVCGFCAQGITKKFSGIAVVKNVDVNLDNGLVTLSLKKDGDLSNDKIAELLHDSGFSPGKIERLGIMGRDI